MKDASKTIDAAQIERTDPRLFDRGENLFLFLRGHEAACSLLSDREDVFGRPVIAFSVLRFTPLDFLGRLCLHCNAIIEDVEDLTLWLKRGSMGGTLHETCFRKWFVLQDKEALAPYRFARVQTCSLSLSDGTHKLRIGKVLKEGAASVEVVAEIPFAEVCPSSEDARRICEEQAIHQEGRTSEMNILICPRCDAPNKISFLDTEGIHRCEKCSARFRVRIDELPG